MKNHEEYITETVVDDDLIVNIAQLIHEDFRQHADLYPTTGKVAMHQSLYSDRTEPITVSAPKRVDGPIRVDIGSTDDASEPYFVFPDSITVNRGQTTFQTRWGEIKSADDDQPLQDTDLEEVLSILCVVRKAHSHLKFMKGISR